MLLLHIFAMGSLACKIGTNVRAWPWHIAPIQDQEIPLYGAKFSTNYLYHAKFYIFVKIHPLSLFFIHFYSFRVARTCVPMSSYELAPVIPENNDLRSTKMLTKLSHLKCIRCWCAKSERVHPKPAMTKPRFDLKSKIAAIMHCPILKREKLWNAK